MEFILSTPGCFIVIRFCKVENHYKIMEVERLCLNTLVSVSLC